MHKHTHIQRNDHLSRPGSRTERTTLLKCFWILLLTLCSVCGLSITLQIQKYKRKSRPVYNNNNTVTFSLRPTEKLSIPPALLSVCTAASARSSLSTHRPAGMCRCDHLTEQTVHIPVSHPHVYTISHKHSWESRCAVPSMLDSHIGFSTASLCWNWSRVNEWNTAPRCVRNWAKSYLIFNDGPVESLL